jgi:hypothetical protein
MRLRFTCTSICAIAICGPSDSHRLIASAANASGSLQTALSRLPDHGDVGDRKVLRLGQSR